MKIEANSIWPVYTPSDKHLFFKSYLTVLKPYHNMPNKAIELGAWFLEERYELSKSIKNEKYLNDALFSTATKKDIIERMGITTNHYMFLLNILKKSGVIINKTINPKFIPAIDDKMKTFCLVFAFKLDEKN